MGRTISEIEARVKKLKKEFRPNVIVVIITDGEENSSKEFNITNVNATITKLRKKGYEFVFIGANQDAIKAGAALGIAGASSLTYAANAMGTCALFDSMADNVTKYRMGSKADMSFEAKDFKAQADAGVVSN
jgi:ADP-heptose:LPS heptosyltransferase